MDGPKALGLPATSEKLFDFLPNIEANMAGIAGNLASIGTNAVDIQTNAVDIQTNADNFFTNYDDIQALETMGSGSVWFDAFRYVHFINISHQSLSWSRKVEIRQFCHLSIAPFQKIKKISMSGPIDCKWKVPFCMIIWKETFYTF